MGDGPAVSDHYRSTEGEDAGAIFRVVGVDARTSTADRTQSEAVDEVTLLRLTDRDGSREATGDLRHVSRQRLDRAFTPASDPDPRFELPDYLAGLLLLAGVALAIHPAGDRLGGAILAVGGAYLLWRRH
ncbi:MULTISPECIES: hypothetical protein [Halolamina]|uniref:Uncharacterized protein n=1 Tax=Halolamina pelagica TaxID=699431 RepID=A0A1I5TF27_9EURY|nr:MULTISPECIES: hypothetical protein [Halolamina]NHX37307.1 hypothetical protein [Halolamina sp. R1-12]SFP81287.1 hypothetical protein SAMN05216277_10941 [Halolamina pelagica]